MRAALIVCVAGCLIAGPAEEKSKKAAEQKAAEATMTGCVDQRGENFVLSGDRQLKTVAILHGDGFSDDNFARHMGHTVTVQGTVLQERDGPVMKVRKITHVSDVCAPE